MQENDVAVDNVVVEAFFAIANEGEKETKTIEGFISENPNLLLARDEEGKTILHIACETGNLELLKFLVGNPRTELEAHDNEGHTPLYYAGMNMENENKNADDILICLSYEIIERQLRQEIFVRAFENNNISTVIGLIKEGRIDKDQIIDSYGLTPLQMSFMGDKFELGQKLLNIGANPFIKNPYGKSATDFLKKRFDHYANVTETAPKKEDLEKFSQICFLLSQISIRYPQETMNLMDEGLRKTNAQANYLLQNQGDQPSSQMTFVIQSRNLLQNLVDSNQSMQQQTASSQQDKTQPNVGNFPK